MIITTPDPEEFWQGVAVFVPLVLLAFGVFYFVHRHDSTDERIKRLKMNRYR